MENTPITFNEVPDYLVRINGKLDALAELLRLQSSTATPVPNRWFSIEELSNYLPGYPAVTTIYGWVQRREVPFSRNGKRLIFRQSEIDEWLQSGRVKTSAELSKQADQYVQTARRKKGGKAAA